MAKSPTIIGLEELFAPLDNTWINKNSLVINYARNCGLAVGGSIAMAISNKKPHKVPNDFDFFTDNNDNALSFLTKIITWLAQRPKTNYKVLINNKTKFTLQGVSHHIRILVPFWKPICIMTLESPMRVFHFKGGLQVQYFDDVVAAAKQATDIDSKDRLPFDVEAARADIRNRYVANGTYDINYEPPVRAAITPGIVATLPTRVRSRPSVVREVYVEEETVNTRNMDIPVNPSSFVYAPYIPILTTESRTSTEYPIEPADQDLDTVVSHFESHGAVATSMNQRRASNDRIIDSARRAVAENPLGYVGQYQRSYDNVEIASDALVAAMPSPRNSPSIIANTRQLRTRVSASLAEALQETEIANCNS